MPTTNRNQRVDDFNAREEGLTVGGQVTVTANSTVDVTAAVINLKAPMVKCDGVVKCETLITQAVVSPSYTPGAGNIW